MKQTGNTTGTSNRRAHTFTNGDRMPLLGLGTWKAAPGEVDKAVREAIRLGYRHIDCAALYGNEAEVGGALRAAIAAGDVTRAELFVCSKFWGGSHGRDNVAPALKKTLADLGLGYVDLYLMHWPIPLAPGVGIPASADDFLPPAQVPLPETWRAMEALADAGLARHLGVSNFSARKLRGLLPHCRIPLEVNQVERHPLLQQNELVAYCASQGIHVTAYSPLGSGDRPAFIKAPDAPVLLNEPVVRSIAELRRCTPAQVLLTWQLQQGVSIIPKSVTPKRLAENLAAGDVVLEKTDMERLAALDRGYRLISGDFWTIPGSPWTMETLWD